MKSMFRVLFVLGITASAFAQQAPAPKNDSKPTTPAAPKKVDRAAAYYHYLMAHMYEEQVAMYGRSELANKAIEEYRQRSRPIRPRNI